MPTRSTATSAAIAYARRRRVTVSTAVVWLRRVNGDGQERQLNIHLDPEQMAGSYANFANITFSPYEFTVTFARVDMEIEEGEVPGVVVLWINISTRFFVEFLTA